MPREVLSTFYRDGRTCAIVRVEGQIVEVIIEPQIDGAGETAGYHYWIRTSAESQPSEHAALVAAMQDVRRLSRIQRVAVVHLTDGGTLNAC